jgi:thiamine biosynthesis lipoprotein
MSPLQGAAATLTWDDVRVTRRFRAMNTDIELVARDAGHARLLHDIERWWRVFESRFSRFSPDSELSRFNQRREWRTRVSDDMAELLAVALRFHQLTDGIFEPAVLPQLESAGYDRSFERLTSADARVVPLRERRSIAELSVDLAHLRVEGPPEVRLDLGGIGKGFAVDRAAAMLAPAADVLINAGGDIYAEGREPAGDGWYASVADPLNPERDLSRVWLRNQALATSSTATRRWRRDGVVQHHIIDPRTGKPAVSDVLSASVIAPLATAADVFAKCAVILGSDKGLGFLARNGAQGFLALAGGAVTTTAGWPGTAPDGEV